MRQGDRDVASSRATSQDETLRQIGADTGGIRRDLPYMLASQLTPEGCISGS